MERTIACWLEGALFETRANRFVSVWAASKNALRSCADFGCARSWRRNASSCAAPARTMRYALRARVLSVAERQPLTALQVAANAIATAQSARTGCASLVFG